MIHSAVAAAGATTAYELDFDPEAIGFVSAGRESLTGIGAADTSHAVQSLGFVDSQLRQASVSRLTELGADRAHQRWVEGKAVAIPGVDPTDALEGEVVQMASTSSVHWSGPPKRYRIGYVALGNR